MAKGFLDKNDQSILSKFASKICMAEGFEDNQNQLILSVCSEKGYHNDIN